MSTTINDKKNVAITAAALVENDMIVGLGTGSTANYFIEALAHRQQQEALSVTTVASSIVSTRVAAQAGLKAVSMEHLSTIDLYVDGADEVTADLTLLKGRGVDLVREKLLAKASEQFYVLVDNSKLVNKIGDHYPIPVEVMPFAWQLVLTSLEELGGVGNLRTNASGEGLTVTSHGSLVLDMIFSYLDSHALNTSLNAIPGVVEHGLFTALATTVFIGINGKVERRERSTD